MDYSVANFRYIIDHVIPQKMSILVFQVIFSMLTHRVEKRLNNDHNSRLTFLAGDA